MLKKLGSSTVVLALFVGCTPIHTVTYKSTPIGATIYCEGKILGIAPVKVEYPISDELEDIGILSIRGCNARWRSGANTPSRLLILDLPLVHFSYSDYSFNRPNFPNYEEDKIFALEREQFLLMKRREKRRSSSSDDHDGHNQSSGMARMSTP